MGKYLGEVLPPNIFEFFQKKSMTGIASTVDEDGFPRGAPMSMFYALDNQNILMAVQNRSGTFKNAGATGKIALSFIGSDDIAFSLQANAVVFRENMENSKHMGILLLRCRSVKSDVAVDVKVKEGMKTPWRSDYWKEFVIKLLAELRSYTLEDIE
jgi:hypothetical protein